jgi:hypothetical protein
VRIQPARRAGAHQLQRSHIAGFTFIVDYYIDWAYATNFNLMFRTFASLPPFSDSNAVPPQRLRGFTLAPNGILYITTGTDGTDANTASGSVIALQEQSPPTQQQTRGGSKVLWRWQSHGGYSQIVPGPERTDPVIVPPSTIYREPNEYFMRFVGQFLRFSHDYAPRPNEEPQRQWMNFTFRGAPIYYDGAVYAFAEGQARVGPFGFPYTVIVALDAEPEQFVIDLGAPIAATGDIRISQRDYGRSGPNPITNIVSSLTYSPNSPNPDIKVDYATGQIRITGFAQADGGGQIRLLENVLSLTQPVQINVGTFNTLVDPDSIAGNWNNLRWYAVLLGQQLQANPVVVGDTMYLPCRLPCPQTAACRPSAASWASRPTRTACSPTWPSAKTKRAQYRAWIPQPPEVPVHHPLAVHRRPDYRLGGKPRPWRVPARAVPSLRGGLPDGHRAVADCGRRGAAGD